MCKRCYIQGHVVQRGQDSFLWEVTGFYRPEEDCVGFMSWPFKLADAEWMFIMEILCSRIGLRLRRLCIRGRAKFFSCSMGVRHADGKEEAVERRIARVGVDLDQSDVPYAFDSRADEGKFLSSDTLTVTFRLREVGEAVERSRVQFTLIQNLKDLYISGRGCDVKFKVKNRLFSAHRSILVARTPVLAAMLTDENWLESNTGVVSVEDCDPESFEIFLFFLYCCEIENLTAENVMSVYYMAEKYQVPELKNVCLVHMVSNLTNNNVCDVLCFALMVDDKVLIVESSEFFQQNAKEIFCTFEWKTFMVENTSKAKDLVNKYANGHLISMFKE